MAFANVPPPKSPSEVMQVQLKPAASGCIYMDVSHSDIRSLSDISSVTISPPSDVGCVHEVPVYLYKLDSFTESYTLAIRSDSSSSLTIYSSGLVADANQSCKVDLPDLISRALFLRSIGEHAPRYGISSVGELEEWVLVAEVSYYEECAKEERIRTVDLDHAVMARHGGDVPA
ncbi:hypothetical protein EUX98_g5178 [Antrodiella citrinella]|uniref:Uncharacterized protein n=1 Tax=Antrodiella citrinella TaxID=2447956 RepID=A0A4S4MU08_9APHY|nr:hypothetical protein EUX98_g5178 [Antrodiella citrinella]